MWWFYAGNLRRVCFIRTKDLTNEPEITSDGEESHLEFYELNGCTLTMDLTTEF